MSSASIETTLELWASSLRDVKGRMRRPLCGDLQQQRNDNPQLRERIDTKADAMARATDPAHVMDRIKETHEDV